jgi:hypothetical protein
MTFNSGAFMIAGTAIAIAGVGLYIWDTRVKSNDSYANNTTGSSMLSSILPSNNNTNRDSYGAIMGGKSRKHNKRQNKKTKRR